MDKGRAMIDVMNRLGVTHCSLGNHECDAGIQAPFFFFFITLDDP